MLLVGIILFVKDKELLTKRLNSKEKERTQKMVIIVSSVEFAGCFVMAGLDFRYGWSHVLMLAMIIASVLFLFTILGKSGAEGMVLILFNETEN